jgi:hypothetical protein
MSKFVRYLSEDQIERDAYALLAEYAQKRALVIEPPIPIDDIVEKHLKLGIEFDDTHRLFGVPRDPDRDADILGAMFFDDGRIVIDESLDPEENPVKEGRYRFTLAHEVGHWRLHRHRFAKNREQAVLFGGPAEASIICRSSQAKERIEWQADFYASCLVMPKELLISAWLDVVVALGMAALAATKREFGTVGYPLSVWRAANGDDAPIDDYDGSREWRDRRCPPTMSMEEWVKLTGASRPTWGPEAPGAVSLGDGGYRVPTYEEQCRIAWAEQARIRAALAEAEKNGKLP